tara:strand:+ start:4478 stop:5317 length:840 start_codon:yes stop_codon:yes gene_type:complete
MRIGSKSENEFFLKLNKRNEIIQENFLKLINNATQTVGIKVMLGDSTVKEVNTFDPKNVESFFNRIVNSLNEWKSQGISYSYNDDVRRIFLKLEIREGDYVVSVHASLQFHVLLYYKPVQRVLELQKELSEIIDKTNISDSQISDEGNKIILQKLQDLGYDKINEQNLFELFYNDENLSKILSEKIEGSQENETIEFNNKKKELLNQLDDLLLETFQTSSVLIDEQKLVNGEEGCLCNIDLEYIDNNSKQGLFNLDLLDEKSQEKIEARINQIFVTLDA